MISTIIHSDNSVQMPLSFLTSLKTVSVFKNQLYFRKADFNTDLRDAARDTRCLFQILGGGPTVLNRCGFYM